METDVITIQTGSRPTVRDITPEVERFLRDRSARHGVLHIFVPHATAGIALIETGSSSDQDLLTALDQLLPTDDRWRHRHGRPGHGRDHVLPAFVAPYATIPVIDGRLALGTWQSVCLVDTNGDNPTRQVRLSLLSG
jgi:secondary thiamine-phosphate synthase enzyme